MYHLYCSKSFNSKENTAVVTKLVREIKGLNPTFDAGQIRGILKLISGYAKFMFYIF